MSVSAATSAASDAPSGRLQGTEAVKDARASGEKSVSASSSASPTQGSGKNQVCLEDHAAGKPACLARQDRAAPDSHAVPAVPPPAAAPSAPSQVAGKELGAESVSVAASQPMPVCRARDERDVAVAGFGTTPALIACMVAAMLLGGTGSLLVWVLMRHRLLPAETCQLLNATLRTVDAYLAAGGAGHGAAPYILSTRVRREAAAEPPGVASSRNELIRNIIDENLQLRS